MKRRRGRRNNKRNNKRQKNEGEGEGAQEGTQRRQDSNGWYQDTPRRDGYRESERKNKLFQDYYAQQLQLDEEDQKLFFDILPKALPTTFRIINSSYSCDLIKSVITTDFEPKLRELQIEGENIKLEKLPWYPNSNGWYLNASRSALRKSPILSKFHKFLMSQTDQGHINRQEAVSMLPPLFLDVQPHHIVLDMCAAPGSKTSQLIEFLHAKDHETKQLPSGLVIANDLEEKRCYMLVHQIKRFYSPCVMITNYPAQGFPIIKIENVGHLDFDRILCDVPCSGDGTLRKNFDLWAKWSPNMGITMHPVQLKIATRGARLLKVGGRLVYSTCSLNALENEAVVAELLRRGEGALELVDVSEELVGLKRRPGLTKWKVGDVDKRERKEEDEQKEKEIRWYEHWDELGKGQQRKVAPSCFPPTDEENTWMKLERCVRVYPHLQDTGGFFVAVLHKIKDLPPVPENPKKATGKEFSANETNVENAPVGDVEIAEKVSEVAGELKSEEVDPIAVEGQVEEKTSVQPVQRIPRRERRRYAGKEEPFLPLSEHMLGVWDKFKEYYGIKDTFPADQLMARSEKSPNIFLISPGVRRVLWAEERGWLKLVHTGVKLASKYNAPGAECEYRLQQDGLFWIYPYLTKRVVHLEQQDLVTLLKTKCPQFHEFSDRVKSELQNMSFGSAIFSVNVNHESGAIFMLVSGWRAKTSAYLLVSKVEITAFKETLYRIEGIEEEVGVESTTTQQTDTSQDTVKMEVEK
eukprot:TRINITY_DN3042_c0_g1_i1.p1 TRINITY_DN3042_c0_g1~~TRINITY_DN3042_c0_g1_i1.p1  ORF type:complete len:751 (+),score=154.37 TRINITY_DN3042_c0_g1_i1:62-2314(+)